MEDHLVFPPATKRRRRKAAGECDCAEPRLVVAGRGAQYPTEPTKEMSPIAALRTVVCRVCGASYKLPWRLAPSF
ncbi:hypothetical protein OHU45_26725 [Streptomyces tubercidicus]|uniref:hypothetical protein n=1 Tax=Streptomyces tubercidicus TaxID=47759 RepID=UPI0030E014BF